MTFEEFFIKKRINLAQLRQAKPDLYDEFRSHYDLMGEKSFDHTKKYWFNRLRKEYLLNDKELLANTSTADVREVQTPPIDSADIPTPAEGSSPPVKPLGFKPRFKAGSTPPKPTIPKASDQEVPQDSTKAPTPAEETSPPARPLGFKPRFKSASPAKKAATKTKDDTAKAEESAPSQSSSEKSDKTIHRPESNPKANEAEQSPAKPIGFKPRFKPGVTGKKTHDGPKNP